MWPAGGENDATSQYRLLQPAKALIAQGADVEISYRGPTVYWSKSWKGLPEPPAWVEVLGCEKPEADVVVIQRPARRWWADVTPHLQAHGVKVVVDVDDRFDRIHKRNVAYAGYNPKTRQNAHDADWVDRACRLADLVTCSTPALVQRYGYGHGVVLPNLVPEGYLWIFGDKRPNTVGWTGSVDTHPGDLEVTGGALRSIPADWSLHVIGTGVKVREALGYRGDMTASGWVPFSEYPEKYAELELAIVPLKESPFNDAKCIDLAMRVSTLEGVKEIGDLVVGDHVWSVSGWVPVEATERQPPKLGVDIKTKRGRSLKVTNEHRMWVNGGWTTADQIKPGDVLEIVPGGKPDRADYVVAPWPADSRVSRLGGLGTAFLDASDGPHVVLNERWAQFLGLFLGDGSVGQATAVSISCDGQDSDLIATVMEDLRSFGLAPRTEVITTYNGIPIRRRAVLAASANLIRFMYGLGMVDWDGANVGKGRQRKLFRIPPPIWQSPPSVQAAFLRGLFEADGTCARSSVSFTTKDEHLARDVQLMLGLFGIDSFIAERWNTAKAGDGTRYRNFLVRLRRHGSDVFAKEIGFMSKRKLARLADMATRPHSNAYLGVTWEDEVVAVLPLEMETADIQVQGSEFVAEGLRTHNSSLKAIEAAALGVPVIMSPTPDNVRMHKEGVGVLAGSPGQWRRQLRRLTADSDARMELADRGRTVMERFTFEARADRWFTAWESTVAPLRKAA